MAPLIAAAGVAALQLFQGQGQAEAIRQNAEYQRQVGDMNARFAEVDAYEAEKFGYTEVGRYQNIIDSTVGEQRANYAAQNVDVNYGTAADVQTETKLSGFLNQLELQRQAREKAMGFRREARNLRLGTSLTVTGAQTNAAAAETSGLLNAAATGLSGYERYNVKDNTKFNPRT
jgi:hypothetical protein